MAAGRCDPLGATWSESATNFAVYSSVAERVELCLLHDGEEQIIPLPGHTGFIWHGLVQGVKPGTRYGYRVHGRWAPEAGRRCNPHKLLLDPYARQIRGPLTPGITALPYVVGSEDVASEEDSKGAAPTSVVTDDRFDWAGDRRPDHSWSDTVIYETHVKGFSQLRLDIPPELRGTYRGLSHPSSIEHFHSLGITAVELMPVQAFLHDGVLTDRGLKNYWGYNSIGFFAPHPEYAVGGEAGDAVRDFKQMVRELHAAKIEVILDVVYNHTAEGNHLGPMISFRGLDNETYYRLVEGQPRYYVDCTGTGQSVNVGHPQVLQLITDSLRYWVTEMRVDGFRFDLAVALGRATGKFESWSSFFGAIHQDPVLRKVKLVAEPWDIGDDGYKFGAFPPLWSEWNDRFRDVVRDFWRGEASVGDFAARLAGSADTFAPCGRSPRAGVNYVAGHDGYTLRDLVTYQEKHNEANGENNRDGEPTTHAWNLGVEGETDDAGIQAARDRQVRNLLATLFLSHGTPMLGHGDELGRTQRGNNNAYCQDNEISWIDWATRDVALETFVRQLMAIRRDHPVLRSEGWWMGAPTRRRRAPLARWFRWDGKAMTRNAWTQPQPSILTLVLEPAGREEPPLCVNFAASIESHDITLPPYRGGTWLVLADSAGELRADTVVLPRTPFRRPGLSTLVMRFNHLPSGEPLPRVSSGLHT